MDRPKTPVTSIQERIRTSIESEILSGVRPPGSAIDEKALAASFNASRTPVREALMLLSAQGLVHIAPRSGIYVRRPSAAELAALLEALCEIESTLARLAARRVTPEARDGLVQALASASRSAAAADGKGYAAANTALHELIYSASGNPVLVDHARSARKRLAAFRLRGFEQPGRLQTSDREHHRIVEAICRGDADEAAAAMREHISAGGEALVALLLASSALGSGATLSTS
ncbi:MAG TPA: GntR family transcriptional regulator [Rhizobacter sp.]|nr:GntR family transcriptional regulator [Rhizobacter sp.]